MKKPSATQMQYLINFIPCNNSMASCTYDANACTVYVALHNVHVERKRSKAKKSAHQNANSILFVTLIAKAFTLDKSQNGAKSMLQMCMQRLPHADCNTLNMHTLYTHSCERVCVRACVIINPRNYYTKCVIYKLNCHF